MIKKQQKWIAVLVVCAFAWLLQVSSLPLNAAGTQVGAANSEQGPDYYEAVSHKAAPAKKSILPVILIAAGAITVTAVVLFLLLKSKYDITGTWDLIYNWGYVDQHANIIFSGDKKAGTFTCEGYFGTYTVDGKNVTFNFPNVQYIGTFSDKSNMSGTMDNGGGTWRAVKLSSAAAIAAPAALNVKHGRDSSGKQID